VESNPQTLAELARAVAVNFIPATTVETTLAAIGSKADMNLSSLDAPSRGILINHFVRSIRNIGVHTASKLEHALLEAAGCCPAGRRIVALKDAISLIAVRNQTHAMATAIGLPWSESMRLQSAVSDVARFVVERGGGRLEMEETLAGLLVSIRAGSDLGPIAAPHPPWLISTMNLAKSFRSARSGGNTYLEFCFSRPQTMVA
jgi:hypothetical protein